MGHAAGVSEHCDVRNSKQGVSFRTEEEQELCENLELELVFPSSR
jgi:hypothetical protein